MKRSVFLFIVLLSVFSIAASAIFAGSLKKIDTKGIANIVFSSSAIEKGKENPAAMKTVFTSGDKIFARCYFPRAVGSFKNGETCHVHLWVDGKVIWHGEYSGRALPEPSWDQIQIYVRNTGDDDFRGAISNALDTVSPGSHEVQVVVLRDKFMKYKKVIKGSSVTKEPVYQPVYLSKGTFNYTAE